MDSQKGNRLGLIQTIHGVSYPVVGAVAQPYDDANEKNPTDSSARSNQAEKTTAAV